MFFDTNPGILLTLIYSVKLMLIINMFMLTSLFYKKLEYIHKSDCEEGIYV
jgi:hypothetical protein